MKETKLIIVSPTMLYIVDLKQWNMVNETLTLIFFYYFFPKFNCLRRFGGVNV
jgi:hypothetical protein